MKKLTFILMLLVAFSLNGFAKADKQVVEFAVELHCQACIDKIMHHIAFERGVKDIVCSMDKQTVLVTFDANKTDVPTLQKAFDAIKKPAIVVSPAKPVEPKK